MFKLNQHVHINIHIFVDITVEFIIVHNYHCHNAKIGYM